MHTNPLSSIPPRIVLTPGEPAGIGLDVCIVAAQRPWPAELVVVADRDALEARAQVLGLPLQTMFFEPHAPAEAHHPGVLNIISIPTAAPVRPGHLDVTNARYVLDTLRRATLGCLNGEFAALVTGPVHKGILSDAGVPFTGHTEYLAEIAKASQVVMMLAADTFRVALATTHLPLSAVSAAITRPLLERIIETLHRDLVKYFGIAAPRILVCGLNPHAGESGHLGREEIDILAPVIARFQARGLAVEGPFAADTVFTPTHLDGADAVLAMYHDQGLPVLKYAGFGRAVNITLGLPFVRTSVDHGTALDLAASGRADASSMVAALETAITMARVSRVAAD